MVGIRDRQDDDVGGLRGGAKIVLTGDGGRRSRHCISLAAASAFSFARDPSTIG